jgi:ribokinase
VKTAVLGSINVDLVASVPALPSPGETVGGGEFRREPGGKGANQAHAAARLGADVTLFGAVGDDQDGERALAALERAGVKTGAVRRVDAPTGVALIAIDRAGENQIVVCPGANRDAVAADTTGFDLLIAQLEVPVRVVEETFAASPAFTVLNASPVVELPERLIERADLIVVNEHEYAALPRLQHAERVVVTYGAAGSAAFERGRRVAQVPARDVAPVNTVGAGDAYCAAIALCLAGGMGLERALATASVVGAAAVMDQASQPQLEPLARYEPGP